MLSRQIAQSLRGYETPSISMIRRCCARPSKASSTSPKSTATRCITPSKPTTTTICWLLSVNTGWASTARAATSLRKAVEAGFDPKGIVYAGVGKRDKEPSLRHRTGDHGDQLRIDRGAWNSWTGLRARPARRPTWRCASTPTSIPRPITASIPVRPTVSSAFHMKRCLSMPRRSNRSKTSGS